MNTPKSHFFFFFSLSFLFYEVIDLFLLLHGSFVYISYSTHEVQLKI